MLHRPAATTGGIFASSITSCRSAWLNVALSFTLAASIAVAKAGWIESLAEQEAAVTQANTQKFMFTSTELNDTLKTIIDPAIRTKMWIDRIVRNVLTDDAIAVFIYYLLKGIVNIETIDDEKAQLLCKNAIYFHGGTVRI